jgi:hypothetical protein
MKNNGTRDIKKAATVQETAELTGLSTRSIRRVLEQKQENAKAMAVFMELTEGKNLLIERVKEMVPFL